MTSSDDPTDTRLPFLLAAPLRLFTESEKSTDRDKLGITAGLGLKTDTPVQCKELVIAVPIGDSPTDLTSVADAERIEHGHIGGGAPTQGGGWHCTPLLNNDGTHMLYIWEPERDHGTFDGTWDLYLELDQITANPNARSVNIAIQESTSTNTRDFTEKAIRALLQPIFTTTPPPDPAVFARDTTPAHQA